MPKVPESRVPNYVDVEPCPRWIECLHGAIVTSHLGKNSPMRYNIVQNHEKKQPIKKPTIGLFVVEHYQTGMTRKKLLELLMGIARKEKMIINQSSLRTTITQYRTYRRSQDMPL